MIRTAEDRDILRAAAKIRKRTRKARPKSPKATRGRVHDNVYLAHVRRQPCRIALHTGSAVACAGRIDPAHINYSDFAAGRLNGKGVKSDDRWAVSLCRKHHDEQHARGNERAWWASYGLDGSEVARAQFAAFTAERTDHAG